MGRHYLDSFFDPSGIAIFGASQATDSVGGRLYHNALQAGFEGRLAAINPKHTRLGEQPCYPSLSAAGGGCDLAVIATPAATVPGILRECGQHGVRAAVVLSAGFSPGDSGGAALDKALTDEARRQNIRLLGPNCLGLMRPRSGLNLTFSGNVARPGNLALISQSGALCTAILDWADAHQVGFSSVISIGDAVDVEFGDLLDYHALDPETRSILLYIEGIRGARKFMSGLRAAARLKPVVAIKVGRHGAGAKAALSHTGSLVGADDVFEAALLRAGAVRALTVEQLFAAAQVLAGSRHPRGRRLAVVTNAGGPGVLAADRAVDCGVELADLSAATLARLDHVLPQHWSHGNPVDILGDATPERYAQAVQACLEDCDAAGVLAILTPQAMTQPEAAADALIAAYRTSHKPVLACWMGETLVAAARERMAEAGLPTFPNPETAVEAFACLANYRRSQAALLHVPGSTAETRVNDVDGARLIIEGALAEKRTLLSPLETKAVLRAFDIPVVPSVLAHSPNEALAAAEYLGLPVALKIDSPDITHKSDVDGVRLNIQSAQEVRAAYNALLEAVAHKRPQARIAGVTVEKMHRSRHARELLVGVVNDPVFGPVVAFGAGGTSVELWADRAVALPPLNRQLAEQLIEQTRVSRSLGEFRGHPPVAVAAVVKVLLNVSELACELPELYEMDLNPLVVDEQGAVALDARLVVRDRPVMRSRYDHMAIHPYPTQWVSDFQLTDGTTVVIRPIRPEDAELEQAFVRSLSEQSRYFRFMQTVRELSQATLARLTQLDYGRELALLAVIEHADRTEELGVARYAAEPDGETAEFAIVVADAWQRQGIGSRLLTHLIDAARAAGLRELRGEVLAQNAPMCGLLERFRFHAEPSSDDPTVRVAVKKLV